MRNVKVSSVQLKCTQSIDQNIKNAEKLVRLAADEGANIILLPELFETQYFCQERKYDFYSLAKPAHENKAVLHFMNIAKELGVVIPISFYEKDGLTLFNSVATIDADGEVLGVYRKVHIPDDHYYQEKFYFTPGNTGFKVFNTRYAKIGIGICWDQWFPETARILALKGAEVLLYPTAIGSEPILECDSAPHWQLCMQGHSAANIIPVVASNRIGEEKVFPSTENGGQKSSISFYGSSFITNETGQIIKMASRDKEEVLTASFDLDEIEEKRFSWGLFRDRRPDEYIDIIKK